MIPGEFDQKQNDEDCVPFQPPDSIADLHSDVIVVKLLPVHNGAVVLNLTYPPRHHNILESWARRGEFVQQFITVTAAPSQRHLGGCPAEGAGGIRGIHF